MKKEIGMTMIICLLSAFTVGLSAQTTQPTMHEARKWFKSKEWLGGVSLKPHPSIDVLEFAIQYRLHKQYWDEAFAFMKNNDLTQLKPGNYPIDGDNVYASITESATKDPEKVKWESHRNYIDLQYVITGEEKIGVCPINDATVTVPYNPARDAANYSATGKIYDAKPGTFFIFFPSQAHKPGITAGGNKTDKKLVIKIKVAS